MEQREDKFNIGDKIELIKINSEGEQVFTSQILDITKNGKIIVSEPIYEDELVSIHKDEKIKVRYTIQDKGKYVFNATVLGKKTKSTYRLEIRKTSRIKKWQQRKYYRLEISIPVTKCFVIKKGTEEIKTIENCETKDISGSGLKLYSNFKHNIEDIINCKFMIEDHIIDVKGKVVRVDEIDTFDYTYAIGIDFIDLDEDDRDIIVKFIFLKERLLIEKGLI